MLLLPPPLLLLLLRGSSQLAEQGARVFADRHTVSWVTPSPRKGESVPVGRHPHPPAGPYLGNGDVVLVYSGNGSEGVHEPFHYGTWLDGQQWLSLSKNDMWMSDSTSMFTHLSAGRVGVRGPHQRYNGTVQQRIGIGALTHTLQSEAITLTSETVISEGNVILTSLRCDDAGSESMFAITLSLSDTNSNHFRVQQSTGSVSVPGGGSVIWWRKENLHQVVNPAYLGSCDPLHVLQSTQRSFRVDPRTNRLSMANGSCLWAHNTTGAGSASAGVVVTTGSCSQPRGCWKYTAGDIEYCGGRGDGGGVAGQKWCLGTTAQHSVARSLSLSSQACGQQLWALNQSATAGRARGFLSLRRGANSGSCLVVIPDNANNTLGVAVGMVESATGRLLKGTPSAANSTDPSAGMELILHLRVGVNYTILTALQTLRDIGCAGSTAETTKCAQGPEAAAVALVGATAAPSSMNSAIQSSRDFWAGFWNESQIDLGGGEPLPTNASDPKHPDLSAKGNLSVVSKFYHCAQYLLASTTRDGKVTPALDGLVVTEPVAWGDQFTLDYNAEANSWGAGSSNHLSMMKPVMASWTNPGSIAAARERATNPGVWMDHGGHEGPYGHVVPVGSCDKGGGWAAMGHCPDLSNGTGFRGASWPDVGFPMADGRLSFTDGQTRFTGGLMATNLIMYYEYTRDQRLLNSTIYPFVRDNAEFYASYATFDAQRTVVLPYTCGQEQCVCRDYGKGDLWPNETLQCKQPDAPDTVRCDIPEKDSNRSKCRGCLPDITTEAQGGPGSRTHGEHNAHADIAFASASFRKAIEYSLLLGVDADLRRNWQSVLSKMPAYPVVQLSWLPGSGGDRAGLNSAPGLFTEASYGHAPGLTAQWYNLPSKVSNTTPMVWPFCNANYPISNVAAMWPTDEIGVAQTADTQLLAIARATVYALNDFTKWENGNGYCLSWPPAVRVSTPADSALLIGKFRSALDSGMSHNGNHGNGGGMLENSGATAAINEMLLQSHGGRLRFFPVWDAATLGPAAFTTLRAYGAFLVSAAINAAGVVGTVSLWSERGEQVVLESPFSGKFAPTVTDESTSRPVTVRAVPGGYWSFNTTSSTQYSIAPQRR